MAYLIGAILIVLLIALVIVFRPPKQIDDSATALETDAADREDRSANEQLDLDTAAAEKDEETDAAVLTLDETEDLVQAETGGHDEDELDLAFDTPGPDRSDADAFGEELDLELDLEEGVEETTEDEAALELDSVAELSDEPQLTTGEDVEDEEIPFIVDEDDVAEGEGEISPALGEVPDDYAQQLDEEEAPGELAERLDYFLGSGDEEEGVAQTDAPVAEQETLEEASEPVDEEVAIVPPADEEIESETTEEVADLEKEEPEALERVTGEAEQQEIAEEEQEEPAVTSAEPIQAEEEKTEIDEDVVFMEEDESTDDVEEISPALGDVPDDYAEQIDESEAPEELAERLDFFLGTGDEEESETEVEEPVADTAETGIEEESPVEEEAVAATPEAAEAVPAVEAGPDMYGAFLARQEAKLRGEMNEAIQNRKTGKIGLLGMALESLCTKQADISQSFQVHQQMLDALDGLLAEVQQALPGFQTDAVRASLKKEEYDVVQTMLSDGANQLAANPQLAAKVLYFWGRFEEERGELATARDLFDRGCSADPENLDCIFASGRLARIGGDVDDALSLLEQRVQSGTDKGEDSINMARAQFELAKNLAVLDTDPEKVEELLNQSLATVEKALGPDNHNLGPILHELAALHDGAGRHEQAEPLYKRSLEVVEKALGSDSPRLGQTLSKLAGLYDEMEKQDLAETFYKRALDIKKKVLGEDHPDIGLILGHLANMLKAKGQYDQAEPMYKKSLEIAEATLGKDHPNLAMVYNEMFELYSEMGNEEQAGYYQEKAFSAFGMPGMGDGFVEMEKDTAHDENEDDDQQIAGS